MLATEQTVDRSNGRALQTCASGKPSLPATDASGWLRLLSRNLPEVVLATLLVFTWVVVFTAGATIPSQPFRNVLSGAQNGDMASAILLTVFTFTPPNVALLCCLSGAIGAQTCRVVSGIKPDARGQKQEPVAGAFLRGFCMFVAILAGVLALNGNQFAAPTVDQYLHLAGMGSLLGFVAGFSPRLVVGVLARASSIIGAEDPQQDRSSAGSNRNGGADEVKPGGATRRSHRPLVSERPGMVMRDQGLEPRTR